MFRSDEEFWKALERFNAFIGNGWRWETTTARKEHVDEFGVTIARNDTYFRRQYAPGFGAVRVLSRKSIEKVLGLVLECNSLGELADRLIADNNKRLRALADKLG